MNPSGKPYLPESNADYEAWMVQNPQGYVINAIKDGSGPMVWHQVGCGHIRPDGVTNFIGGDFIKVCALDPGELAVWAKQRPEPLKYCKDCQWKWEKENGASHA